MPCQSENPTGSQQHPNLGISRVGIKDVGEEFTGTCHSRNHQSMDIEAIDYEEMREIIAIGV